MLATNGGDVNEAGQLEGYPDEMPWELRQRDEPEPLYASASENDITGGRLQPAASGSGQCWTGAPVQTCKHKINAKGTQKK